MRNVMLASFLAALAVALPAQQAPPLRLVVTIPLPNVDGRIDHFGIDLKGQRLFMSALGNDTVEVFDLRANQRLHTITGLHEPQGVTYAPDSNRIYVANGDDGKVRVFDGTSYKLISSLNFGSDADDTRYDAETDRVYVGYGEGAVAAMDSATGKVLGEVKVRAHPEAYEVEKGGGKIFVNVPNAHEIAVADWSKRAITSHWRLDKYGANFPMAYDSQGHRLFVVCRRPAELLVLDIASGKIAAHLPVTGDADDVWYDPTRKRLYISGGEGYLSVVEQQDADHYRNMAKIPTAPGARTSFFSPELGRLYLAVPHSGDRRAELRVYASAP
ncbi:MAG TPA: YncE family protein [Terriglobia bacterium]|nr:YncE family protein [Terriglobia bacterium]